MSAPVEPEAALTETLDFWTERAGHVYSPDGGAPHAELVNRSLLVLRALTHSETGGIVATPTTSLPEEFGGARNWDYRFTWLRDAAFTIEAMISHDSLDGATLWRDGLLAPSLASRRTCGSWTAWAARRTSPRSSWSTWPGTRSRARSGSATGRRASTGRT